MQKRITFDEIRNNNFRSVLLILLFLGLASALGILFGLYIGSMWSGVIIALVAGCIYAIIAYYSGRNIITSLTHAKPVTKREYPHIWHAVEGLAIAAGIPAPKVYVINDSALNAFATGRNPKDGAIVLTTGIIKHLNRQELEGVIAHEMSHIKNYDIRVMMIAAVITGVVVLLSDIFLRSMFFSAGDRRRSENGGIVFLVIGIVLAILAPIIAQMIKLAISRKREYAADAGAATLTRYPQGLADALKKIAKDPDPLVDTANRATAHLFISTPFRKSKGFFTNLFSTHPPIRERIKRLESY